MTRLPFIDRHAVAIAAPPEAAFDAAAGLVPRLAARGPGSVYARLVGCDGGRPFHVARSDRPRTLILRGGHRFSRYELALEIEPMTDGASSTVQAATSAAFPGFAGSAYRVAVIGSGAHGVAMRRLLASIKARAERAAP